MNDRLSQYIKRLVVEKLEEYTTQGWSSYDEITSLITKGYLIHGTTEKFSKFDQSKIKGGTRAEYGYGMYFTDATYKALEYGNEILYTKKDIYNFLDLQQSPSMDIFYNIIAIENSIYIYDQMMDNARNEKEYNYYKSEIDKLKKKLKFNDYEQIVYSDFKKNINGGLRSMEQVFKTVRNNLPSHFDKHISSFIVKCGYDGVNCGNQYVVYNFEKLNSNLNVEQLNEVRYVDTNNRRKKDPYQVFKQSPIKDNESIRVFHGCDLETAVNASINGLSGQLRVPRKYSYESGMNPKGLFVTTDFEIAKKFTYDPKTLVVIEFTAKAKDLDTPVWNNSASYFGQGSNPVWFKDKEEREAQKQKYQDDAKKSEYDFIRDSDNPAMAERIFDNSEHQSLFVGNLNPNMIKRYWVKQNGKPGSFVQMDRKTFLKKYGNTEFETKYNRDKKEKIRREKSYLPNEDFISLEDMVRRDFERFYSDKPKFRKRYSDEQFEKKIQDEADMYREGIKNAIENEDYYTLKALDSMLYPKQIKQLLGDELYDKVFPDLY